MKYDNFDPSTKLEMQMGLTFFVVEKNEQHFRNQRIKVHQKIPRGFVYLKKKFYGITLMFIRQGILMRVQLSFQAKKIFCF